MTFRVLIIEDEESLRTSVVRGLQKLANVTVDSAGSIDDALECIDAAAPDLIISDIDLPERSGIELLGELGARDLRPPLVFVTAYLKAYGVQIPRHAAVDILEKPVPMSTMRELVTKYQGGDDKSAEGAPFSLPDYIQISCMGKHSVRISLTVDDEPLGQLTIVAGELWSARCGAQSGADALKTLFVAQDVAINCQRFEKDSPKRNLEGSWEHLLFEAARESDEQARGSEYTSIDDDDDMSDFDGMSLEMSDGADESGEAVVHSAPFEQAWKRGVEALLEKSYDEALTAFHEARDLDPDDRRVQANIARLEEMREKV